MKKVLLLSVITVLISLFISCIPEASDSKWFDEIDTVDIWDYYAPKDSSLTLFWDDFEGASVTSKNAWEAENVKLTTLSEVRKFVADNETQYKAWANNLFGSKDSKVLAISTEPRANSSVTISNLSLKENCLLTFRYFMVGVEGSNFDIYINDDRKLNLFNEKGVNNSNCFNIKTVSITVPAETESITFEAQNKTGYHYVTWPNSVYIDDVSLVQNKTASVVVTPKSSQKTYVGCPEKEKVHAKAYALRADGTVIKGKKISYSANNGTVNSDGWYSPKSAGSTRITASCDGKSAQTGEITVFKDNFSEEPFVLGGVEYKGVETESGELLSEAEENECLSLEYPKKDSVSADGFVRFKGSLKHSLQDEDGKIFDKVGITVSNGKDKTIYICDKDFDVRVWLPFDGESDIVVGPAYVKTYKYQDSGGNIHDGDYQEEIISIFYEIKATNTHSHTAADSGSTDGRYIYPSFFCQSDNYVIQNFTNEALYGVSENASDAEKFKAIHDYVVTSLYYDYDSIENNGANRKKQDAVSVVQNETGVCAGYASLIAAMARYVGMPVKFIGSEKYNHAWNHVMVDGEWYFCDATWDDPNKDPDSDEISYTYYLLEDFDGVNKDHDDPNEYIENRSMRIEDIVEPELPWLLQEGYSF